MKHEEVLRLRFHAFLRAVFQETANELRRCLTSKRPNQSLAAHWRQHLDSANNREQFYDRVVAIAVCLRFFTKNGVTAECLLYRKR